MTTEMSNARLRLAAAARSEVQLRELVAILLSQGDALFASRSWRIGSALTGTLARCASWFGGRRVAPQTAEHWREIVDAHYDALHRQRVLLDQLCAEATTVVDADVALEALWNRVGDERVLHSRS